MNNLKQTYPALKTSLAVGGWNFGTARMTAMLSKKSNRAEFISTRFVKLSVRSEEVTQSISRRSTVIDAMRYCLCVINIALTMFVSRLLSTNYVVDQNRMTFNDYR